MPRFGPNGDRLAFISGALRAVQRSGLLGPTVRLDRLFGVDHPNHIHDFSCGLPQGITSRSPIITRGCLIIDTATGNEAVVPGSHRQRPASRLVGRRLDDLPTPSFRRLARGMEGPAGRRLAVAKSRAAEPGWLRNRRTAPSSTSRVNTLPDSGGSTSMVMADRPRSSTSVDWFSWTVDRSRDLQLRARAGAQWDLPPRIGGWRTDPGHSDSRRETRLFGFHGSPVDRLHTSQPPERRHRAR